MYFLYCVYVGPTYFIDELWCLWFCMCRVYLLVMLCTCDCVHHSIWTPLHVFDSFITCCMPFICLPCVICVFLLSDCLCVSLDVFVCVVVVVVCTSFILHRVPTCFTMYVLCILRLTVSFTNVGTPSSCAHVKLYVECYDYWCLLDVHISFNLSAVAFAYRHHYPFKLMLPKYHVWMSFKDIAQVSSRIHYVGALLHPYTIIERIHYSRETRT